MLQKLITEEYAIGWLAMLIIVITFAVKLIAKSAPAIGELYKNIKKWEDINKVMNQNSKDIEEAQDKLKRDYDTLNSIQKSLAEQHDYITDSLEERRIILNVLLCITKGLQEIGANGPTKEAEKELTEYINQKAHER